MKKTFRYHRFVEILKDSIQSSGLGVRQLGRVSGLDPSFISKMLKCKRNPPDDEAIEKLASALSVDRRRLLISAGRIPPEDIDLMLSLEVPRDVAAGTVHVSPSPMLQKEIPDDLL